jgi:endo-1,4-beta-xylanase
MIALRRGIGKRLPKFAVPANAQRALSTLVSLLTWSALACSQNSSVVVGSGGRGGDPTSAGQGGEGGVGGEGGASGGGGEAGSGLGGGVGGGEVDAGGEPGDGGGGVDPTTTLKYGAERAGRLIGAALTASRLSEASYAATAAAEFNYVTPENEMKWTFTEATRGTFTFEEGDAIAAFAAQHGMLVKGHTLVWHSQLPTWVSDITDPVDLRNVMLNHIFRVVTHFRGKVVAWDVVNEAVADSGQSLRDSVFYQRLGAEFIDEAFRVANTADPDARLYYNEYGAEGMGTKSNAVYNLVQGMLARGVPIHGVGLQMHTGTTASPPAADVASNIQRLGALGLEVVISEMDVQICTSDLDAQSRRFHDIVAVCVAASACKAVTVWGVPDKYSWRNGQSCASPKPLLFDDDYIQKPAHAGVLDAFLGR